jgi:hypothetical protein
MPPWSGKWLLVPHGGSVAGVIAEGNPSFLTLLADRFPHREEVAEVGYFAGVITHVEHRKLLNKQGLC